LEFITVIFFNSYKINTFPGLYPTDNEVNEIIVNLDKNGTGTIELQEITNFMTVQVCL